jgi:type IV pilus assembly protein PilN
VILINLLPHREAKRRQRRQAFYVGLGAAFATGALAVFLAYGAIQQQTTQQQARNDYLQGEIGKLDSQIKDIANLRQEIDALRARQKAVEDLQSDRNTPVHLLDELVKQAPEGIYLTSIKQNQQVVTVTGIAQTNERVSELLRNVSYNAKWLERPELVEIKAANVTTTGKEQRRLFDFQMRVSIKRGQQANASGGASAPSAGSAATTPGAVASNKP